MIGIDPHKASHTVVAVDESEEVMAELKVRACRSQTEWLREWAAPFGERVWAIESARGLGCLLCQQLVAVGETVVDVPAMLSTRARLSGPGHAQKNDPNDARSVAIAALRHPGPHRVGRDDHARVLKLLVKRHRDLGRLKNRAACRLHALLMEFVPGGMAASMTVTSANTLIDSINADDPMVRPRVEIALELADDIAHYDRKRAEGKSTKEAIRALKRQISNVVYRTMLADARRADRAKRWAREGNQEQLCIQRDRLTILNSRLFGSATSPTHAHPTTMPSPSPGGRPPAARTHPRTGGLTQRGFAIGCPA